MRTSQDLQVCETVPELQKRLYNIRAGTVKKPKGARRYVNLTCTFDIETTNTETDGFAYTFQFCVGGICTVLRYYEDFRNALEMLVHRYRLNKNTRMVFYIHNAAYEYYYLIQLLCHDWQLIDALYTKNNKPLYFVFSNGIEFRDSLKLFQKSLARATEGCKHAKLVGDLDYSVYRTPDTPLTQQEFDYCVNDVIGLWEALERLKKERKYNQATIPLTQTAMVIDDINNSVRQDHKTVKIMQDLALDPVQLQIAYQCMAGGDTHGNRYKAGHTWMNCNSYDFKSAHPSQQLLQKFPTGKPWNMDKDTSEAELSAFIRHGMGWCAKCFIYQFQIKPGCPDPTISNSKCEGIVQGCTGLDNGRVLGGEGAFVYMDSNDYQRFREAYNYKALIAVAGFAFRLDYLPKSFRKPIIDSFIIKESMKGSPDYMWSKAKLNSIFGACAQKTIRDEYISAVTDAGIVNDRYSWQEKLNGVPDSRLQLHKDTGLDVKYLEPMTPEEVAKTQEKKFPFLWGLWTSSMTRLCLWQIIKIVGWDRALYWDTDSVKYIGEKSPEVEAYNAKVRAQCEKMGCVVTKGDKKVYIGVAEDEHPSIPYGYRRFRFLHAKCYADEGYNPKTGDYELESTIAGVGKKEGIAALKGNIDNLSETLYIDDAGGKMLEYHNCPIKTRSDFQRPTCTASYVRMLPRTYDMRTWKEKAANTEETLLT